MSETMDYEKMSDDELNRLVAERIFGWSDFHTHLNRLYGFSPEEQSMGVDREREVVRPYSRHSIAWFSLVEEIEKKLGLLLEFRNSLNHSSKGIRTKSNWIVIIQKPQFSNKRVKRTSYAHACLFRATCIAALQWWEANGGETK